MFASNTEYEILTPNGWCNFNGITEVAGKITHSIKLKNGEIVSATAGHYFFINDRKIKLQDLSIGDFIDTISGPQQIIEIKENLKTTVYDIVEVDNEKHQFIVNHCFITKNCDEFAYVLPNIASEFWTSISPTLATGGKAIITSTPNSDEDEFATIWKESQDTFDEYGNEIEGGIGRNGFFGFKAEWNEHPDRDEKWMKEEMGRIGLERFNREYGLQFLVFEETLINSIRLTEIITKEPIMKMGEVRWFKKPKRGNVYMVSLDPSLGTGGDFGAIQVFELPSFEQVAEWQHNVTPIQGQVKIFREILRYIQEEIGSDQINDIYWSTENNTVGEAALIVIADLGEETFPGLFISEPVRKGHVKKFRKGFNTTFNNKISACSRLKYLIEEDKMKINSKPLLSQLKSYIASGVSFKAKPGQHDDLVAAMLLVIRMSVILSEWDPKILEILSVSGHLDDDWEAPLPLYVSTRF